MKLKPVLIVFILANLIDTVGTIIYMRMGVPEANPAMAFLMDRFGVLPALIIMKLLAIAAGVNLYVMAEYGKNISARTKRLGRLTLIWLTFYMCGVVAWHLSGPVIVFLLL